MPAHDARPIAVFDSGIGGLTVLKELAEHFPNESFLYLGDTARLPYGSKSPETIRKYAIQNIEYLSRFSPKAIVIACNTASAQMPESNWNEIPLYNVITPGAIAAVAASEQKRIGVIGTRATIESQAYQNAILKLEPKAEVFSLACPLFVPLAEEGWIDDPVTNLIVFRYLQGLLAHRIDTLVMGCTHYPILKNSINRAVGSTATLVDSGEAIARILKEDFKTGKISSSKESEQKIDLMFTDGSNLFSSLAGQILSPTKPTSLKIIDL